VLSDPKVEDDPELKLKTQGYLREAEDHSSLASPQPPPDAPISPRETKPLFKKWWFWTAIGGATLVVVAVGVGVGVGLRSELQLPAGAPIIRF
jgi:hypothetical protein